MSNGDGDYLFNGFYPPMSADQMRAHLEKVRRMWSKHARWSAFEYRAYEMEIEDAQGRPITLRLPPMPKPSAALAAVEWFDSYQDAGPWHAPFWKGFWNLPDEGKEDSGLGAESWGMERERGRRAAMTKAGEAYRLYIEACRNVLRRDGWPDDDIP